MSDPKTPEHYQTDGELHWDRMWRLYGRGYFVGCATKYIERYHKKDGMKDLEKAIHFIEKLITLEYGVPMDGPFNPEFAPLASFPRYPQVKTTGWEGYTFEGSTVDWTLYTCKTCHTEVRVPHVDSDPNDYHKCAP